MTRRSWIALLLLAVSAAVIVFVILHHADSRPDPAACKVAMEEQFAYGVAHPDGPVGSRPAACEDVDQADLQRFASEIMEQYMNGGSS